MDRLDGQVRRELGRFGPVDGDMIAIVRAWPEAVGDTVSRNAWPARLARDGTLHVNAVSATWAFELGRLAETILERLQATLTEAAPPALKFVPGPVPDADAKLPEHRAEQPPAVALEHRVQGAQIAAAIEDEELREYVARAAAASLARGVARGSAEPRSDRRF
jgi:hypothetical protein